MSIPIQYNVSKSHKVYDKGGEGVIYTYYKPLVNPEYNRISFGIYLHYNI